MDTDALEFYTGLYRQSLNFEWIESDHPRGQPENAGEFSPKGGGSTGGMAKASRGGDGKIFVDGKPAPEHIQKLRLPPAWTNLEINPDPNGALVARGMDKKGRVQSVYSESHSIKQAALKFSRIRELAMKQDEIDRQNVANLSSEKREIREAAAAMALIRSTGIRPGSDRDTGAEKQAYGATTLRAEHVQVNSKGEVRLVFVGKKGVDLDIPIADPGIASMIQKRATKGGRLFAISDSELRDYAHTLDGGSFKPKDFRTLKGTQTAIAEINKRPKPKNDKEYKAAVKEVATIVSQKLGNTPAIALQSYIDPTVFSSWRTL